MKGYFSCTRLAVLLNVCVILILMNGIQGSSEDHSQRIAELERQSSENLKLVEQHQKMLRGSSNKYIELAAEFLKAVPAAEKMTNLIFTATALRRQWINTRVLATMHQDKERQIYLRELADLEKRLSTFGRDIALERAKLEYAIKQVEADPRAVQYWGYVQHLNNFMSQTAWPTAKALVEQLEELSRIRDGDPALALKARFIKGCKTAGSSAEFKRLFGEVYDGIDPSERLAAATEGIASVTNFTGAAKAITTSTPKEIVEALQSRLRNELKAAHPSSSSVLAALQLGLDEVVEDFPRLLEAFKGADHTILAVLEPLVYQYEQRLEGIIYQQFVIFAIQNCDTLASDTSGGDIPSYLIRLDKSQFATVVMSVDRADLLKLFRSALDRSEDNFVGWLETLSQQAEGESLEKLARVLTELVDSEATALEVIQRCAGEIVPLLSRIRAADPRIQSEILKHTIELAGRDTPKEMLFHFCKQVDDPNLLLGFVGMKDFSIMDCIARVSWDMLEKILAFPETLTRLGASVRERLIEEAGKVLDSTTDEELGKESLFRLFDSSLSGLPDLAVARNWRIFFAHMPQSRLERGLATMTFPHTPATSSPTAVQGQRALMLIGLLRTKENLALLCDVLERLATTRIYIGEFFDFKDFQDVLRKQEFPPDSACNMTRLFRAAFASGLEVAVSKAVILSNEEDWNRIKPEFADGSLILDAATTILNDVLPSASAGDSSTYIESIGQKLATAFEHSIGWASLSEMLRVSIARCSLDELTNILQSFPTPIYYDTVSDDAMDTSNTVFACVSNLSASQQFADSYVGVLEEQLTKLDPIPASSFGLLLQLKPTAAPDLHVISDRFLDQYKADPTGLSKAIVDTTPTESKTVFCLRVLHSGEFAAEPIYEACFDVAINAGDDDTVADSAVVGRLWRLVGEQRFRDKIALVKSTAHGPRKLLDVMEQFRTAATSPAKTGRAIKKHVAQGSATRAPIHSPHASGAHETLNRDRAGGSAAQAAAVPSAEATFALASNWPEDSLARASEAKITSPDLIRALQPGKCGAMALEDLLQYSPPVFGSNVSATCLQAIRPTVLAMLPSQFLQHLQWNVATDEQIAALSVNQLVVVLPRMSIRQCGNIPKTRVSELEVIPGGQAIFARTCTRDSASVVAQADIALIVAAIFGALVYV